MFKCNDCGGKWPFKPGKHLCIKGEGNPMVEPIKTFKQGSDTIAIYSKDQIEKEEKQFRKYLEIQAARQTLLDAVAYVKKRDKREIDTVYKQWVRDEAARILLNAYTHVIVDLDKLKSEGKK
jgi:hypothetical protein